MAMSSFKRLQDEQDTFIRGQRPDVLEDIQQKVEHQQGIFRLFADVAELFLPQTVNTFFKMVGSDDDVVKPRPPHDDDFYLPNGRG